MIFLTTGKDYLLLAKSETPINPNPEGKRRVHCAFAVHPGAAYDNAKAFLQKNGVVIFDEEDRKTGVFPGRQFYIHDPDRNVIEFSEFAGSPETGKLAGVRRKRMPEMPLNSGFLGACKS